MEFLLYKFSFIFKKKKVVMYFDFDGNVYLSINPKELKLNKLLYLVALEFFCRFKKYLFFVPAY